MTKTSRSKAAQMPTTSHKGRSARHRKQEQDMDDTPDDQVQDQPSDGVERRGGDRRGSRQVDRRSGLDRRRGPGRRRAEDRRSAEEGEMNEEQFDFVRAINEYKEVNRRPFPTWTEVLDIIKALGYRKVAERQDIQ